MAILWPSTLPPVPLYDGYSESAPNTTLRTAAATGPAKVRKKSSAMPWQLNFSMMMTDTQIADFKTFVYDTLSGGALRFEMKHPRTGGTVEMRILGNESLFTVAPAGSKWQVSFLVEVLP